MKNDEGSTPVHLAVECSDKDELVREMVQLNLAALEVKNHKGNTPLHLAPNCLDRVETVVALAQLIQSFCVGSEE